MADLITVHDLRARLSERSLVLLDIRYTPGKSDGKTRYLAGHIPGAIYVDLATELADADIQGEGTNPLPTKDQLQQTLQRLGVKNHSEVVVYDDTNLGPSARAWWVLRWAGLKRVAILDGGLNAWISAGEPISVDEDESLTPGDVQIEVGALRQVSADDVLSIATPGTLVDVRPAQSFLIDNDGKGGHIPGAVNLPAARLIDEYGRLLAPKALRALFAGAGIDMAAPITAYCGSGVAAALFVFASHRAELDTLLYPGSWSHWVNDRSRPIQG